MISLETCLKWQYKVSKSSYLVTRLTGLETSYLRMWVLTIWILSQRLGIADRTASLDLSQKVELLLLPSTLNLDWRICLVKKNHICILGIQYTSYSFDITTLIVPFSKSKILCSIKTVLEVTINSSAFEFAVST